MLNRADDGTEAKVELVDGDFTEEEDRFIRQIVDEYNSTEDEKALEDCKNQLMLAKAEINVLQNRLHSAEEEVYLLRMQLGMDFKETKENITEEKRNAALLESKDEKDHDESSYVFIDDNFALSHMPSVGLRRRPTSTVKASQHKESFFSSGSADSKEKQNHKEHAEEQGKAYRGSCDFIDGCTIS